MQLLKIELDFTNNIKFTQFELYVRFYIRGKMD